MQGREEGGSHAPAWQLTQAAEPQPEPPSSTSTVVYGAMSSGSGPFERHLMAP